MALGRGNTARKETAFSFRPMQKELPTGNLVNKVLVTSHWFLHCKSSCLLSFSMAQYQLFHYSLFPSTHKSQLKQCMHCCQMLLGIYAHMYAASQCLDVLRYGSTQILIQKSEMHGRYCHCLHCTRRLKIKVVSCSGH